MEPYLQRYPCANTTFGFRSSRYPPQGFFPLLYQYFYIFMKRVEPYLQRYPYTNTIFGFRSSRYLRQDFFPPFCHLITFSWKVWSLTSNDTPTTTPYSDSPPRVTYPKIFFQPSLPSFYLKSLLRHSKAPTSTLRQHHVRIPLVALRALGIFPPLYLHFNNFN